MADIDLRPAKLQRDAGILGAALGIFDNSNSNEDIQDSLLTLEENRGLRKV
jgi:hypothetical protein